MWFMGDEARFLCSSLFVFFGSIHSSYIAADRRKYEIYISFHQWMLQTCHLFVANIDM